MSSRCGFGRATGIGGGELGDHEGTSGSEDAAEDEGEREGFEAAFGGVDGHGDDGVDDWGTSENDGHDGGCRGAFVDGSGGAEGEHEGEGTEGTGGACDEAPGDTGATEGVSGATHFQEDGGGDADEGVGDADEEEGLQASVRGLCAHGHEATGFVEENTIDAPREDGEKGKDDPIHISHGEGMRGGWDELRITDYEARFWHGLNEFVWELRLPGRFMSASGWGMAAKGVFGGDFDEGADAFGDGNGGHFA